MSALVERNCGHRDGARTGGALGLTSESRLKAIGGEGGPDPECSYQILDKASVLRYSIDEYITSELNKPIPVVTSSCETGTD
jgi:hypothetical protein